MIRGKEILLIEILPSDINISVPNQSFFLRIYHPDSFSSAGCNSSDICRDVREYRLYKADTLKIEISYNGLNYG